MNSLIAGVILILCLSSYFFGRSEARKLVTQNIKLKALPAYYGYYLANKDKIKAAAINAVKPSLEGIQDYSYPIATP